MQHLIPLCGEIFLYKIKKNTSKIIDDFIKNLKELKKIIKNEDGKKLEKIFIKTKKIRKKIIELGQDVAKPDFGRKIIYSNWSNKGLRYFL